MPQHRCQVRNNFSLFAETQKITLLFQTVISTFKKSKREIRHTFVSKENASF